MSVCICVRRYVNVKWQEKPIFMILKFDRVDVVRISVILELSVTIFGYYFSFLNIWQSLYSFNLSSRFTGIFFAFWYTTYRYRNVCICVRKFIINEIELSHHFNVLEQKIKHKYLNFPSILESTKKRKQEISLKIL